MVNPLHALLVRLKKLHVKVGQEDRKNHVKLQIRKATTAHNMLEQLLKSHVQMTFRMWPIGKGLTHFMPMHCREPLENATFHRSSSLPFSPSQRSGLKDPGSGNRSRLS